MLAYWIHQFDPFLIHFPTNWPLEGIRWYGCAYLLGFWIAWIQLNYYTRQHLLLLSIEQQQSLLFNVLLGILFGGRLGYVLLYQPTYYFQHPEQIFAIWNGGMSAHGGFLGVYFALLIFSRQQKLCLYALGDLIVCLAPIGICLGRLANFVNAEVVGRVTSVPWAVIFPQDTRPRHPSQLYEAIFEGLLLFFCTQKRLLQSNIVKTHAGHLTGKFLIFYSLIRFLLEYFREPDAPLIGFFTRGQMYSLITFVLGFGLTYYTKHKKLKPLGVFKN